jgi:hypothetical protein
MLKLTILRAHFPVTSQRGFHRLVDHVHSFSPWSFTENKKGLLWSPYRALASAGVANRRAAPRSSQLERRVSRLPLSFHDQSELRRAV